MSGLKEIRNRISSDSSTMQITNAMKMVSAAKLKKAQDSITATLPYSNKLSELGKNISASIDSVDSNPLFVAYLAAWCGHCQHFKPQWEMVKQELINNPHNNEGMVVTCDDKLMQQRKTKDDGKEKSSCKRQRDQGTVIFPAMPISNEIETIEDTTCIDTNRDELLKSFCE